MVKYIEFRGKKFPVRIRYYALAKFQEETGKDFTSLVKLDKEGNVIHNEMKLSYFEPLLYHSLISGAKAMKEKEVKVPWEDAKGNQTEVVLSEDNREEIIEEMLEDCYLDFAGVFPAFFPTQDQVDEVKKPSPGNRQTKRQEARLKQ